MIDIVSREACGQWSVTDIKHPAPEPQMLTDIRQIWGVSWTNSICIDRHTAWPREISVDEGSLTTHAYPAL